MDLEELEVKQEKAFEMFFQRLEKALKEYLGKLEKVQKVEPLGREFNVYLKEEVVFWRSESDRWKDLYLSLLKREVREEEVEEEGKRKEVTV